MHPDNSYKDERKGHQPPSLYPSTASQCSPVPPLFSPSLPYSPFSLLFPTSLLLLFITQRDVDKNGMLLWLRSESHSYKETFLGVPRHEVLMESVSPISSYIRVYVFKKLCRHLHAMIFLILKFWNTSHLLFPL